MAETTIIGSGPAAVAVALALQSSGMRSVRVLDLGETLEPAKQSLVDSFGQQDPADWPPNVQSELSQQPVAASRNELPEKTVFGSDYVFRDRGQLSGFTSVPGGNAHAVSSALGGLSNAWGAQIMPFSRATIDEWPIGYDEMLPHYRHVLSHVPLAGGDDDYSELFPLLGEARPLPPLSAPATAALGRYQRHRARVRHAGVTMGAARLALRSNDCIECGLCLTGCPRSLIYSAAQTMTDLIADGFVSYTKGVLAVRVGEDPDGPWVTVRNVADGTLETVRAGRVFVACGGMGSTRLMLGSVRQDVRALEMQESVQLVLPFISSRAQPDPRSYTTFTLNQFNVLVEYGRAGLDLAQFHVYPYNPAFDDAVPASLRSNPRVNRAILRRTVAALGYLPSWASPRIGLRVGTIREGDLPEVAMYAQTNHGTKRALRKILMRLLAVAPALDLWPAIPAMRMSGPGKSYHFGGSFPHTTGTARPGRLETDRIGRVAEFQSIHLVDGAVLPTVPATTFTLTVMANAHRIATEAVAPGVVP